MFNEKPLPVIDVSPPVCVKVLPSSFEMESSSNFPPEIFKFPPRVSVSPSNDKLPPFTVTVLPFEIIVVASLPIVPFEIDISALFVSVPTMKYPWLILSSSLFKSKSSPVTVIVPPVCSNFEFAFLPIEFNVNEPSDTEISPLIEPSSLNVTLPPVTFNLDNSFKLTIASPPIVPCDTVKSEDTFPLPIFTVPPLILSLALFKSKPFPTIFVVPFFWVNTPFFSSTLSSVNSPLVILISPSQESLLSNVKVPPAKFI